MAQIFNSRPPLQALHRASALSIDLSLPHFTTSAHSIQNPNIKWAALQLKLKCRGRYSCLFSDNRREQEQARKALESALDGKKNEFEKWNKEIQRREERSGGGGASGGGGWFGWGRWFGGSNGDHFWEEAQQASLVILGIIFMYLVVAKGELMLAVIFNPLLFSLRWTRNSFTLLTSLLLRKISPAGSFANLDSTPKVEAMPRHSAKESVIRKWGTD